MIYQRRDIEGNKKPTSHIELARGVTVDVRRNKNLQSSNCEI